jgi:sterol desaturase/sphingolipid hydroxylase (fatty acid hydroxylase superfamily)
MAGGWLTANPFWVFRYAFLAILYLAVIAELFVRWLRTGARASSARIAVNVGMWMVELSFRGATFGLRLAVATWASRYAIHHFERTVFAGVVGYVLVDFIYYWHHRLLHVTKLGWAIHATHHTSEEMTLLSTIRLSWVEAGIKYLFYLPLVFLGFDPLQVFFLVELNSVTQFWCHTELIGPLSWLDPWLNTPQNHRLHHARARALAEGNYGSNFIIWDRIFGTYHTGPRVLTYGIEGQRDSLNPFRLQFGSLWVWLSPSPERDREHDRGAEAEQLGETEGAE